MIKVINECNEILDFAWELCQDNTKVSYPRDNTKNELKHKIERAINSTTARVIGYHKDDKLIGICIYYWLEKDKYAQTEALLINDNYNLVADELLNYIKGHLEGYSISIGITADNKEAIDYFEERQVPCVDASIDTSILKKRFKPQEIKEEITQLELKDFNEYGKFHDEYAWDFYWNSKRLKEGFNNFVIFVYRDNSKIIGSIFTKIINSSKAEVFGLFIDEIGKGKGIEGDLIGSTLKYLYDGYKDMDQILYFIQEDSKDELSYAVNYGFKIKDNYRCYKYKL